MCALSSLGAGIVAGSYNNISYHNYMTCNTVVCANVLDTGDRIDQRDSIHSGRLYNMEPENHWFAEESSLPKVTKGPFSGSMLTFPGVRPLEIGLHSAVSVRCSVHPLTPPLRFAHGLQALAQQEIKGLRVAAGPRALPSTLPRSAGHPAKQVV